MRKILFLSFIFLSFTFLGCSSLRSFFDKAKEQIPEAGDPVAFRSIRLSLSGMSAGETVYAAEQTAEGLRLTGSFECEYWSNEKNDFVLEKNTYRDYIADEAVYEELCRILGQAGVRSWDGFSGSNPHVLDGESFHLAIELEDGSHIYAHGSNSYPKNYSLFEEAFRDRIDSARPTERQLSLSGISMELPTSWVGEVSIRYFPDMLLFSVETDSGSSNLASLFMTEAAYEGTEENYLPLGVLTKGEDTELYLCFKKPSAESRSHLTEKQQALFAALDADLAAMAESLRAGEDFSFVPYTAE